MCVSVCLFCVELSGCFSDKQRQMQTQAYLKHGGEKLWPGRRDVVPCEYTKEGSVLLDKRLPTLVECVEKLRAEHSLFLFAPSTFFFFFVCVCVCVFVDFVVERRNRRASHEKKQQSAIDENKQLLTVQGKSVTRSTSVVLTVAQLVSRIAQRCS